MERGTERGNVEERKRKNEVKKGNKGNIKKMKR